MRTVRWALSGLSLSTLVIGLLNACQGPSVYGLICGKGELRAGTQCLPVEAARSNSVGYLPTAQKRVPFVSESAHFELRDAKTDKVVFEGDADGPAVWKETGEELYVADFSEVTKEGRYYIALEDGRSPEFEIGTDALNEALTVSMLGMYGQRCSEEVTLTHEGAEFSHDSCHESAVSLEEVGGGSKEDHSGWHDAGDYGKYTNNGAFAVAFYLKAFDQLPHLLTDREFEIPEKGGEMPDILDEAKVELVWLKKLQLADGSFSHKATAHGFEGMIMPEDDDAKRYFAPVGTASTGDAVAVLALAARIYKPFDADFAAECLEAAKSGYAFLADHPDEIVPDLSNFSTGAYISGDGDSDERAWAAAEMFATTGDADYLVELEPSLLTQIVRPFFDWGGVWNLALDTYLRAERSERDPQVVATVAQQFVKTGDFIVSVSTTDPYGRGSNVYTWGGNGGIARVSYVLAAANYVSPKPEYLSAVQAQLDYLLGRNPYGRSFVTGLGHLPPQQPHHRPSVADKVAAPWPGLLVGGPHGSLFAQNDNPPAVGSPGYVLPALTWEDKSDDYMHNEIAINWNTALTYALATGLGMTTDGPGCGCLDPGDIGSGGAGGAGGASGAAGSAN